MSAFPPTPPIPGVSPAQLAEAERIYAEACKRWYAGGVAPKDVHVEALARLVVERDNARKGGRR